MGNRRARENRLQRQNAADWERVRTETRPAESDVCAHGIGLRRLQLIVCPSFEEPHAWEVRQRDLDWRLFESHVVSDWPPVQLIGYEPLVAETSTLKRLFESAAGLSLPISPDMSGSAGADGTVIQLALFGDLSSECRFQWWSNPPEQWRPLTDLAGEMLATFAAAKREDAESE